MNFTNIIKGNKLAIIKAAIVTAGAALGLFAVSKVAFTKEEEIWEDEDIDYEQ